MTTITFKCPHCPILCKAKFKGNFPIDINHPEPVCSKFLQVDSLNLQRIIRAARAAKARSLS